MKNILPNFVFFGTSQFSVEVLTAFEASGYLPMLVVTSPDMPKGRKLALTPSAAKLWASERNIPCFQPASMKDESVISRLQEEAELAPLFVVASYGKIIPESILTIAKEGCINIHPSLLPYYRGASPIQSQIIANEPHIGTSIMLMDHEVDHGPIIGQAEISFERVEDELVDSYPDIEKKLAIESAALFLETVPAYLEDKSKISKQEHSKATFTSMIEKSDGLIDLTLNPRLNYRKYLAFAVWPGTYFFMDNKRVLIKKASFESGALLIEKVVPEGKKEMSYQDFLKGIRKV